MELSKRASERLAGKEIGSTVLACFASRTEDKPKRKGFRVLASIPAREEENEILVSEIQQVSEEQGLETDQARVGTSSRLRLHPVFFQEPHSLSPLEVSEAVQKGVTVGRCSTLRVLSPNLSQSLQVLRISGYRDSSNRNERHRDRLQCAMTLLSPYLVGVQDSDVLRKIER